MSRYLVTGGAGFIGSHVVDALVARGEPVRVIDDLSTGRRRNIEHLNGVEFIEDDLAKPGVASHGVAGMDYIVHMAAIPSIPRSVRDPLASHRANVDATLLLLLAVRDAGVRRVVFASSSSAYGESPTLPKHEEMRPAPLSPYALQKLIGERYGQIFTTLYGLDTVSLRFFNVFGPRQAPDSPYSGVISLFISALIAGRRPTTQGDGDQTRDFTFVSDVVEGVTRACTAPDLCGCVLNLARGGRTSINELFATLCEATGTTIEPIYGKSRLGDVRDSQADVSRIRQLLHFEPRVTLEEGLRLTVEWFLTESAGGSGAVGRATSD